MIRWKKPNGTLIETNDRPETVEYCRKLGWVPEGEEGGPKKRGRPKKDEK